ncbi:sigma-54-dependent Fis family transcriptional regulator [Pontibacillus sp. ALD_SL1]|uniref:sigma-54-dependent Fis family transcriptional regulator n=1 Tax=Pontibacillus sp. ALD_SL1 TaxID=2777185 RepID=UPI001A96630C|nr:sigma 54-interacting transcriptional regulator [Pontibacillus sp. ALD_SL1]QST00887.1 sigma-54-dependent Fis family transcriptional regulator [Pontibacillus sp. ALD_SL1]
MLQPVSDTYKKKLLEQSWKRCHKNGFHHKDTPVTTYLTGPSLDQKLHRNKKLIHYARLIFQQYEHYLTRHKIQADLLDQEGYLLFSAKPTPHNHSNKRFSIGSCWSEHAGGTNAVSLSMQHHLPFSVHGQEHFYTANHFLTCFACPVLDTRGNVIAIINFSCNVRDENDEGLFLSSVAADSFQNKLALEQLQGGNVSILSDPKRKAASSGNSFDKLAGSCPSLYHSINVAKKSAPLNFAIHIHGETGTGKELFAKAIHQHSNRSTGPFIAVNCSALSHDLMESELFGYAKGAFTGANPEGNKGKFRAAHKGTLFLDEIGDMPLEAQSTLLRAIEEKEVTPVGDYHSYPVDVRIITATHRNLTEEVEKGTFRADLYYRISELILPLTPLRKRTDIEEIAHYFLSQLSDRDMYFSQESLKKLRTHTWPGNIRELKNVVLQACFHADSSVIEAHHIRFTPLHTNQTHSNKTLMMTEQEAIKEALQSNKHNISATAKQLGITRNTLYRKMQTHKLK